VGGVVEYVHVLDVGFDDGVVVWFVWCFIWFVFYC